MSQLPDSLDFYFDIGSPYAYMAATQMEGLSARTGLAVNWKPFLLGAVFKAVGKTMPAQIQAKARWMFSDLTMWSEHYGVPFKLSSLFPLNTLKTQRALVAAQRLAGKESTPTFALALYKAYWVDDRDVSDPAVIEELAKKAGLDGAVRPRHLGLRIIRIRGSRGDHARAILIVPAIGSTGGDSIGGQP